MIYPSLKEIDDFYFSKIDPYTKEDTGYSDAKRISGNSFTMI